ncbi:unnamed protein product [Blepharisma stoltei]|uniref:non-specific serine/threonine protein kinase n=1 Tax=Blepharisma stoltei TaxID=1481888 RepID=A0AAU9JWT4_9CILI|nr:unnamed protein product [Blepharisma stoltei]
MSVQDFEILSKLGEGAFSTVYKVRRKSDGQVYALKKVKFSSLNQKEKENAVNEIRIMASFSHPNIISYKEAFIDEETNTLCIVMELAEHGDLLNKIKAHKEEGTHFPETEIWDILIQIAKGLRALHDSKILHRDLKCANIFLAKDGVVKLGDLNVSKVNKSGMAHTQTGTPYYASPEVWKNQPYTYSSDIWSFGCVLYEMAALLPPFTATDMQGLYRKIIKGMYPNIPQIYSLDLANVIRVTLQVSPSLRPSCDKILEIPAVAKHMNQKEMKETESAGALLGTIALAANYKNLKLNLPKAKYEPKERGLSADAPRPIEFSHRDLADIEWKPRVLVSARRHDRPKLGKNIVEALNLQKLPPLNDKDAPLSSRRNMLPKPSPRGIAIPTAELLEQNNIPLYRAASKPEMPSNCQHKINVEEAPLPMHDRKLSPIEQNPMNLLVSPPKIVLPSPASLHKNMNRVASLILGTPKENHPKPEPPPFPNPSEVNKLVNGQNPIFHPHPVIHHRAGRPGRVVWWN